MKRILAISCLLFLSSFVQANGFTYGDRTFPWIDPMQGLQIVAIYNNLSTDQSGSELFRFVNNRKRKPLLDILEAYDQKQQEGARKRLCRALAFFRSKESK